MYYTFYLHWLVRRHHVITHNVEKFNKIHLECHGYYKYIYATNSTVRITWIKIHTDLIKISFKIHLEKFRRCA